MKNNFKIYFILFDCKGYEKLWVSLKEMGVRQCLIVLMHNLNCEQEATVRTEYEEAE